MAKEKRYAGDFLAKLAADPAYQAMRREKDAKFAALNAMLLADEKDIIADLAAVGVVVESVWDLVNTREPYPTAIPMLLKHLDCEHHPRTRQGIARALITREARGIATERLIQEFIATEDGASEYKWVVGMALGETGTPETAARIARLALDPAHGNARESLPLALRDGDPDTCIPLLEAMRNDPVTKSFAEKVLKKLQKRRKYE